MEPCISDIGIRVLHAIAAQGSLPRLPARLGIRLFAGALLLGMAVRATADREGTSPLAEPVKLIVDQYCVACHDGDAKKGGLDLDKLSNEDFDEHSDVWERVVRKLRARQMPPIGKNRPEARTYDEVVSTLTSSLDRDAALNPNPGRTETFRRLNRTEYQNAIRDLLALEIDATALLPKDDVSQGFDNVGVGNLSPTLLNRYIAAAEKISRLAIGAPRARPGGDTFRIQPDVTQE
ncbi:MAG TPA: DUF1587 domain-containing protein, partial [Chthoniobacteraceae bacterium]|nr:DUF1587 domain-containing protein [Chthoniobacteraceae bacterium]